VQNSLAQGHLGFSFSSLRQPAGHEGTVPYPDFYLDDLDVGNNPNGAAPRFELQVTILDPFPAGDFDRDRDVDANDYTTWRSEFGNSASPPGRGADGNGDGLVDAADYLIWRRNLGFGSASATSLASVPEPSAGLLVLASLACVARRRRRGASDEARVARHEGEQI
jgi:hypothetical protein